MKKSIYTLSSVIVFTGGLLFSLATLGQNIITENFDSYTADQKLVQQGAPNWTTWSNAPGSAEDPYVRNTQSVSSPNSVEIAGTNDAVLLFNDKTTGRYMINKQLYIPSSKTGYFNLLQNFAGASSTWGMQTYFDLGGAGSVDAGGEGTGTFTFSYDTWIPVSTVIDLDEDFATLYINNELIVEWKWSTGAFGTNNTLKLDAMNLYAWTGSSGGATPQMFADDITFDQIPVPAAPFNLQATLSGTDVSLTWEIPSGSTPTGYWIYKDGVRTGYSTTLDYTDLAVYPGEHTYIVRAEYGTELSPQSNEASIVIEGGTDRQFVLLEIGTGTWCQYCPGSAMGADDLVAGGANVAVIEYHVGDDWEIPESANRMDGYYEITGYPTAWFDGITDVVGGSQTQSMYATYLPIYDSRIAVKALYNLDLTVDWADATNVVAKVTTEKIYDLGGNQYYLRLALTESNIPASWFGLSDIDFVCRAMYPDDIGTLVDFSNPGVQTFTFPISIPSSYVWENLELVAFLQSDETKEVMQSDLFPLTMTAIPGGEKVNISLSPNPVKDYLSIRSATTVRSVRVVNSIGQPVGSWAADGTDLRISTAAWNSGIYFVTVQTEQGTRTVKILKN